MRAVDARQPAASSIYRPRALEVLLSLLLVSGITAAAWGFGGYLGDDRNTLFPVAQHSLLATIRYYIRPIEYLVVQAANGVNLQLWLPVSLVIAVAGSALQVATAEAVVGQRLPPALRVLATVGSPLWFYLLSQVDTVSQSLSNLLLASAMYVFFTRVFPPGAHQPARWAALVNLLAGLLLYSKELAVTAALVLPAACGSVLLRRRQFDAVYLASCLLWGAAMAGWLYMKFTFRSMLPEAGGHYDLSPSVGGIATNLLSLLSFPITPLPTGLLSVAGMRTVWASFGLACVGLLAVALWRTAMASDRPGAIAILLAMLAGCSVPIIYVHSSELYASMVGGYLVTLALFAGPKRLPLKGAYLLALLACSYANATLFYGAKLIGDHRWSRVEYSIYNGPNGLYYQGSEQTTMCPVRGVTGVRWDCGKLVCLDGSRPLAVFEPASKALRASCGENKATAP